MDAKELIELLNKERDYHVRHPFDVALKFLYALGASLAAVVASLYFTDKLNAQAFGKLDGFAGLGLLLSVVPGIAFILFGLNEHTKLHEQHREKLEQAINDILLQYNAFDFDAFWKTRGTHTLELHNRKFANPTPLITFEPDTRKGWRFHDSKISLGVLLLLTAYGTLIIIACLSGP